MSPSKLNGGEVSPLAPASSPMAAGSAATPLSGAVPRNALERSPESDLDKQNVGWKLKIPSSWNCLALIDCTKDGNISYGIVQPGMHDPDGVPIVRINNIEKGSLNLSEALRVSTSIEEKFKKTRLEGGEVLLTLVGSTGQSFVAPKSLCGWNVPRAIAVIRAKDEIGAKWINLCLQTKDTQQFLDERANTTVQKTLNLKDVRNLPIIIPPDWIKSRIENIILSLDDKIELNRRINQTLEEMAQALFKSWFVDFDPVRAKAAVYAAANSDPTDPTVGIGHARSLRLGDQAELAAMRVISGKTDDELVKFRQEQPDAYAELARTASLFPSSLIASDLGQIPEGWEVARVDSLLRRISVGKKYDQKTVSDYGDIPVLDQSASGVIGFHSDIPGVVASFEMPVVTFANHTCNMRLLQKSFSTIQNVLPFVGEKAPTRWLYYATLGKIKLTEYKGHWPDYALQEVVVASSGIMERFDQVVCSFNMQNEIRQNQSSTLRILRDSLLPKLLSGELEIPDELLAEAAP